MKPSDEELALFSRLFSGYEDAHGHYEIEKKENSGKLEGKAVTHTRGAEQSDYLSHLLGKTGIGIVPLLKNDKCWFGAIDIDIKGDAKLFESHEELEAKVRKYDLPLMVFRSKSNGAHLYLFAEQPISARLMQDRLTEFAALLGYGGCEIFPKQITRIKDGDVGNWINLPLHGDKRTAIYEGKELEREKALKLSNYMRISESDLRAFAIKNKDLFVDGPPCLQKIATIGIGEGNRNNALFNISLYMRRKFPDNWQEKLQEFNEESVDPPLQSEEISEIAKQSIKKGYNYTCSTAPICNFCDRKTCLKREFGINNGSSDDDGSYILPITGIVKYVAGKDSYRWGVNTGIAMLEFSTPEILSLDSHRIKFLELLNIIIPPMKTKDFLKQMSDLLEKVETIHDPEDASETGQIVSGIERWFLDKGSVSTVDELVKMRWWEDPESGKIYFRGQSLQDYLMHQEKLKIRPHTLWRILQTNFHAENAHLRIKGKRRRVWCLPYFNFDNDEDLKLPKIESPEELI